MKKIVYVGNKPIGDGTVTIQSMTNTSTKDVKSTKEQINALKNAGADFVRISIPDVESAHAVKNLTGVVPLIGDIHYLYEPALIAIENGISKIRINPSNLSESGLKAVVKKCIEYDIPIRVGVNNGSVRKNSSAKELVDLALDSAKKIEDLGWDKLVLAVKTSDPLKTVEAYRLLNKVTDYPLHIGLTEAGTAGFGLIKSSVVIGALLMDGIGDTVRVSLTGDPVKEIYAAKQLLRAVGRDKNFTEIIACPTCARTEIDVEKLALKMERITENFKKPLKIAVMGCVVNGIGEGKSADFGVSGGKTQSVLFKKGEYYKTVKNEDIEKELILLAEEFTNE